MIEETTFTPCPTGQCDHRALCHTYQPRTRRNDGPCLSIGCDCPGEDTSH